MIEYVGNLHVHTTDSDGHGTHEQVAEAALHAGLDFVIITDHNLLAPERQAYHYRGAERVLVLVGQEVHDVNREPERSHLLLYGAGEDLTPFADNVQRLVDAAGQRGGLSFLAHPVDCGAPRFNEPDLSWEDWDVRGYTGIELWNFMSEYKCRLRSWPHAFYYSYFPAQIPQRPPAALVERWDALLREGLRVVAIGNSDAHALPAQVGPFRRVLFPYDWLFTAVNTHVLLREDLTGDLASDRAQILEALGSGRGFLANDRPASARGFSFTAQSDLGSVVMGEELSFKLGATLQVRCPLAVRIRLVRAGSSVREWSSTRYATLTVSQSGAYRVEAWFERNRAWIFSNPIYLVRE